MDTEIKERFVFATVAFIIIGGLGYWVSSMSQPLATTTTLDSLNATVPDTNGSLNGSIYFANLSYLKNDWKTAYYYFQGNTGPFLSIDQNERGT